MEHRLCDERVDHYDTHRCDTLKESAVLPTMWYRKWELLPAAEQVVRPYIREVVSNRAKQMFMSEATETTKVYVPYYGKLEDGGLCFCAMNQIL